MNFKPNEFFLGIVEFIVIILPGALFVTVLLVIESKHNINSIRDLYQNIPEKELRTGFWVAFAFSSFGFGYFLSSIASGLDQIYDIVRNQIYPNIEKLKEEYDKTSEAGGKQKFEDFSNKYLNNSLRKVLHFLFEFELKIKIDKSFSEANKIFLQQHPSVIIASNTYKWACSLLEAKYPLISEQSNKIMAASKFFRSLVIVALFIFVFQLLNLISIPFWISIFLALLSFREYVVQRQKSTQFTYRSIVTLLNMPKEFHSEK